MTLNKSGEIVMHPVLEYGIGIVLGMLCITAGLTWVTPNLSESAASLASKAMLVAAYGALGFLMWKLFVKGPEAILFAVPSSLGAVGTMLLFFMHYCTSGAMIVSIGVPVSLVAGGFAGAGVAWGVKHIFLGAYQLYKHKRAAVC